MLSSQREKSAPHELGIDCGMPHYTFPHENILEGNDFLTCVHFHDFVESRKRQLCIGSCSFQVFVLGREKKAQACSLHCDDALMH